MKLTNRQGRFLQKVIIKWQAEGIINEQDAQKLNDSFTVQSFDWKKLARYSFWIAMVCALISFAAIVADDYIIHYIASIFESSNAGLCIALSVLAGFFYYLGLRGRNKHPEKEFSNEALVFTGMLSTAGAILYLGRALDNGSGHFSILFLIATFIYGILGLWFPSRMVWVFALLTFGAWYGTEIGYRSGWAGHYHDMNYPILYAVFGIAVVALAFVFKYWRRFGRFHKSTLKTGLLYLFISLWVLSIFGNYSDIDKWYGVKQSELFGWVLLFAGVAFASVTYGIKAEDPVTRGFGITFLFINLYTRYFEYCWNNLHKAVFFFILALSFWFLGRWAERIWNVGSMQKSGEPSIPEEVLEEE